MEEVWKNINIFDTNIIVSNLGNIKTKDKTGEYKTAIPYETSKGYLRVRIIKDKTILVHVLVASAFVENKNSYKEVDHIDRNRKNNVSTNLRWVTHKQNCRNTKSNFLITYKGETKTLSEWIEILDLPYHTIKRRLYRGWDVEDAFEKEINKNIRTINKDYKRKPNYNSRLYLYKGKRYTVSELSRLSNVCKSTFISRINNGWDIDKAVSTPLVYKKYKLEGEE